jgi:signal transduction histidine kinase/ActR/RegA family two-component response regulator
MNGYLVAILATLIVVLVRLFAVREFGDYAPFVPFFAAVSIAAWFGGLGPGLLATILCALTAAYFFYPPAHSFRVALLADQVRTALFIAEGVFLSYAIEVLHRARRRAEASEQEALAKQQELEHEITVRKQAEAALHEGDRRKDEFLATLSHELRNPLAPIRNAVQIQKSRNASPADLSWSREIIERQVVHLARLLDDLLDVTRINVGKLRVRKERVDLKTLVESAVETSSPLIEAAHQQLTVTLPPEPIHLQADAIRVSQVLSNLLNNGSKYTKPGGRIVLVAAREDRDVVLTVSDTGAGIAPEMLPRVFDLFTQGAGSLEQPASGLGVGLSLARALIELHGGTISAASNGPGHGSRFTIRLPIEESSAAEKGPAFAPTTSEGAAETGPKYRLLIADDLPDAADSLAILFRSAGHEAEVVYDGEKAFAAAETMRPSVVLLDIEMPKVNGYEVARQIRVQPWGKDLYLIALTGWGKEEDRRRASEAGFDAHLVKPVSIERLTQTLDALRMVATERVPPDA